MPLFYIVMATIVWGGAAYFFFTRITSWQVKHEIIIQNHPFWIPKIFIDIFNALTSKAYVHQIQQARQKLSWLNPALMKLRLFNSNCVSLNLNFTNENNNKLQFGLSSLVSTYFIRLLAVIFFSQWIFAFLFFDLAFLSASNVYLGTELCTLKIIRLLHHSFNLNL